MQCCDARPTARGRCRVAEVFRRAPLVVLTLVAVGTAAEPARAQAIYTGAQVKQAVDTSLDIMKDHLQFQATQDRYDAMLGYFALTDRFSPMTFASADGTKSTKVGNRVSTMVGGGYGEPSAWGFYLGAWDDIVMIGPKTSSNSATVSYSFNSPESDTFVPLPYAHVFGVQFVLGVPDVAKRLVPIVRPKVEPAQKGENP